MYEEAFELLDKLFEYVKETEQLRNDAKILFEPLEGRKFPWDCPKIKEPDPSLKYQEEILKQLARKSDPSRPVRTEE